MDNAKQNPTEGSYSINQWISEQIIGIITDSQTNCLGDAAGSRAWDEPLVGFAAGDDPLFISIKGHIGDFYWTPEQAYAQAFPDDPAPASELSVAAWILPQPETTRKPHRKEAYYPSELWARARGRGEELNMGLRKEMARRLTEAGYPAAAPMALPQWKMTDSRDYGYASTWSERHAAHVAGLGTFGLCDGLITPRGKAVRVGSVVFRGKAVPTPRPYQGHHDWCLYYAEEGVCGVCIKRCPVGALSTRGHDKITCANHVHKTCHDYCRDQWGLETHACGLCQVKVPCESRNPTARLKKPAPSEGGPEK